MLRLVMVFFGLIAFRSSAAQSGMLPVGVVDSPEMERCDTWAEPTAKYCRTVMWHVLTHVGINFSHVNGSPGDRTIPQAADVILSAFRTPELLRSFDFPPQPLCSMRFALYAGKARAQQLKSLSVVDWPMMRVAYSPALQGVDDDRERFFSENLIKHKPVKFATSEEAVESVRRGETDLLFLYTAQGHRPDRLEEVRQVGERNVYFAVRRTRPELQRKLRDAYRSCYVNEIESFDAWRRDCLGIEPPTNRVRVAAYMREGLFVVSGDDHRQGLLYDWMNAVAQEAGWTLDWVYGTFAEGIADGSAGRLDLVTGIADIPSRRAALQFPTIPLGQIRFFLWTYPDAPYVPNEVSTWKGMRVGYLRGSYKGGLLEANLRKSKAEVSFSYYDSDNDLKAAYHRREIDAILSVERSELAYEKMLFAQIPEPIYACSSRAKPEVGSALAAALARITKREPRFAQALKARHDYGREIDMSDCTGEESAWLEARHLAGGFVTIDFSPIIFELQGPHGELQSYAKLLFDELSRRTGLTFQMAPPTDGDTAKANFLRGKTDLWAPYPMRGDSLYGYGEKVFAIAVPQYYSRRADAPENIIAMGRVAVDSHDTARIASYSRSGLAERLVYCDDEKDCYRALVDGRADCTFSPITKGGRIVEELGYERQIVSEAINTSVYKDDYELLAGPNAPPELVSILRKAAHSIDGARLGEFFVTREMERQRNVSSNNRYLGLSPRQIRQVIRILIVLVVFSLVAVLLVQIRARRREREADRRANEAKSYFFSSVSHDIRTPLNAIIGYSEMLKEGFENEADRREALDAVISSGNVLKALVNDVLDLSKLESGKMEVLPQPSDVSVLVGEVMGSFALPCARNGVALIKDVEKIPFLKVDPQRIRQVLFNLIGNAVKFTAKGSITVRGVFRQGRLTLSVRDTGCGIDPKYHERLMKPYEQVANDGRYDGTGLGLAICRQLAERMDGTLTLKSAVGEGSTFTLDIPAEAVDEAPLPPPPVVPRKAPPRKSGVSRRILIVDDSAVNLSVLAAMLRRLGYMDVVKAANGRDALTVLNHEKIDLVLSDLRMPEMDGIALVAAIRSRPELADLPVYIITADVEIIKDVDNHGFTGILLKPIERDALQDLLESTDNVK